MLTDKARRQGARELGRQRRLDNLARDEVDARARVAAMIATRKPTEYDAAVKLLTDLQALAKRYDRTHEYAKRIAALRQEHALKPSLLDSLNHAAL
ncbi:hypothetical protein [Saccharopolyspora phatthalungensis]|uniref:Uncharacterized protein n=1 Tax=Saccharopolyspora phatthalungensis TaxID=664693 RepID=A0A840Q3H9_9PSEU|nr:hypothetical protein [Saccharopolyspora phatthalungensis]MBB5152925.1 hypothetical protein [Saccharopolyspora phatthalungensis]